MDVLVIGGSVFLGRAVVAEALAAGHRVTVFNRGRSGAQPDGVTQVTGDRTVRADLEQLTGQRYDLVVDTCGYVPAEVALSADVLEPGCEFYAFVSTISTYPGWPAYRDYDVRGVYDGDPDATRADLPADLDDSAAYGWLKVGCEQAVARAFGAGRCSILRAGLIVGPEDSVVGRLPWWIDRIARGGEVLVPGDPDDPISLVDARDLARFALLRAPGAVEVPGPADRDTRADLLAACAAATGSDPRLTHVDGQWLVEQGVRYWTEIPLWMPETDGPATFRPHSTPAGAAGMLWRPIAETVADTWSWQTSVDGGWRPSAVTPGLAPAREQQLLAAWHDRGPQDGLVPEVAG